MYIIGEWIGEGGFSTVYKGQHKKTKKLFALKKIFKDRIDACHENALHTEIAIMKLVQHPHVTRLFHVCEVKFHQIL